MRKLIQQSFQKMKERNWDKIYIAVDIHDTIFPSTYSPTEINQEYYPFAKQTLQHLSKRNDVVLILYSSTQSLFIQHYLNIFKQDDIIFEYVNENPEIENSDIADFSQKFYFNILIDDKAGFDANIDWSTLYSSLLEQSFGCLLSARV